MPRVVHLGAGALGLGLVGPACIDNGLSLVLANRRSHSDGRNELLATKRCYLQRESPAFEDRQRAIEEFVFFEDADRLEAVVTSNETVLLTTALKEYGIRQVLPLLTRILTARLKTGRDLYVVACENAVDSSELALQLPVELRRPPLHFVRCVVDRICNSPFVRNNEVCVETEAFARWYLEANVGLRPHLRGSCVEFVDDLSVVVRRKKWVVNAAHQLLSVCAHHFGFLHLDGFMHHRLGQLLADGILEELMAIYKVNEPNCGDIGPFVGQLRERFETHPSFVPTALTRLTRADQLEDFFTDFQRKVGEPAGEFLRRDGLRWIPLVWAYLSETIAKRNYVPVR